jgi:hypothetical protein
MAAERTVDAYVAVQPDGQRGEALEKRARIP